ncbi:twin-arginine translocase subunit TatC [Methanococcoides seepicolus]|uniref:Sec-independent protein translocase protein TatC n=1 Tax=Methanococcoides seepicolus TaxID=2828780 RepID=A0A9E4ZC07_9EURY|nr:twin-arginine translocase subunit TatC [Methanococcoides seepicolus]MCM1985578.1 preprotein translocase subunit TatC [Methanococcoides seepicolus]
MTSYTEDMNIIAAEMRKKLYLFIIVLFTTFSVSFQFTNPLIRNIKEGLLPEGAKLVYVSPLEVILLKIKIALVIGLFALLPLVLFFVISPLIKNRNIQIQISKRWLTMSAFFAIALFVTGVAYAYYIMLPLFINYLYLNASTSGVIATYSIFSFISFAVQASFIFGIVFETPLFLTLLTRSGIVQYKVLLEYRKHVYVFCLIAGAIITPPDIISQIMVGIPLIIFFELSLLIVRYTGGNRN